jgi:hypothetical protein
MSMETGQIDIQHLIAEVATRHNIFLGPNDPVFALVTMNKLVLEQAMQLICDRVSARIAEMEASASNVEKRAGTVLAQQVKESASLIRRELHNDVQSAGLKARELLHQVNEAHRRPTLIRWVALGILCGLILFCIGLWLGRITPLP